MADSPDMSSGLADIEEADLCDSSELLGVPAEAEAGSSSSSPWYPSWQRVSSRWHRLGLAAGFGGAALAAVMAVQATVGRSIAEPMQGGSEQQQRDISSLYAEEDLGVPSYYIDDRPYTDDIPAQDNVPGPTSWTATDAETIASISSGTAPTKIRAASGDSATSLFCFTVVMAASFERDMVRGQYARQLGIFSCNSWAVYSDHEVSLGSSPGSARTVAIPGPPANRGPVPGNDRFQEWYNVGVFLRAWERIFDDGLAFQYAWTIKVDTDAVFIPSRLQQHLQKSVDELGAGVEVGARWVLNCPRFRSMQGPLEIFSRQAMVQFSARREECTQGLGQDGGEDQFMEKCMKLLQVPELQMSPAGGPVLKDHYCDWHVADCKTADITPACASCAEFDAAVYHPFKSMANYLICLKQTEEIVASVLK